MCLRGFEWKPMLQCCLLAQLSLASTAHITDCTLSTESSWCHSVQQNPALLCQDNPHPTYLHPCNLWRPTVEMCWEGGCLSSDGESKSRGSLATTDSYSTCSNQSLIWGITPVFLCNITLIMTAASTRNVVSSLAAKLFIEESNSLTSKLERLAKLEALYR